METLKKLFVAMAIVSMNHLAIAQSDAAQQKAFSASYVAEGKYNYTEAITQINNVYSEQSYDMNLRLGWLYYLNKNYTSSIKHYEKAANVKPYAIEAKFGLIKPLAALESWDKVIKQYEAILNIDPQNTIANYYLGYTYYNRKQYDMAVKNFEKVVNLYPFDYDNSIMLAWTFLRLGKNNEAKLLFNKVLLMSPNDASALEGLSTIK
jgi:tetratricopeptide (TPR) repeat protein